MPCETLVSIRSLVKSHTNRYVDNWKDKGKPIIGYFCQYTPPEIILASGALPLRLRAIGSEDSSLGDAYMSSRTCTFVRHIMSMVLDEKYDFLDGQVTLNTCDHIRRASDVFVKKSDVPFNAFISVPRTPRESLYDYFLNELKKFINGIEEHFEVKISKKKLNQAIKLTNINRKLLTELNTLRILRRPKISGADALAVHVASQVLPPDVFASLLANLLDELKDFEGLEEPVARFVLTGTELDEPDYVKTIESQGGVVVADQICFGARSVLQPLEEDTDDPLDVIGRAYFFRTSCARMIGDFPNRWETLKKLYKDVEADGIVFQRLIFCDPWGAENHNIMHRNRDEENLPFLSLSREYGTASTGQVKTRVQAFVEKIEIARAKKAAGEQNV